MVSTKLILFAFHVILDTKSYILLLFQLTEILNYPAKALLCIALNWWNGD